MCNLIPSTKDKKKKKKKQRKTTLMSLQQHSSAHPEVGDLCMLAVQHKNFPSSSTLLLYSYRTPSTFKAYYCCHNHDTPTNGIEDPQPLYLRTSVVDPG